MATIHALVEAPLHKGTIVRPPRHRFALINWLAVYPVITLVLWGAGPLLSDIPLPLQTLIISAILVTLMNFAVMPVATRLFRRWLYPAPEPQRDTAPDARELRRRTSSSGPGTPAIHTDEGAAA